MPATLCFDIYFLLILRSAVELAGTMKALLGIAASGMSRLLHDFTTFTMVCCY